MYCKGMKQNQFFQYITLHIASKDMSDYNSQRDRIIFSSDGFTLNGDNLTFWSQMKNYPSNRNSLTIQNLPGYLRKTMVLSTSMVLLVLLLLIIYLSY